MPSPRRRAKISFFFQDTRFRLARRRELKQFIADLFSKEGRDLESLNIIFCTDSILLQINREFLQHDFYTDIITFDLSENNGVAGEMYISAERVKDNAENLAIPFTTELHRVLFHGALHLCGYGDKTPKEKAQIRKKEDFYLSKWL